MKICVLGSGVIGLTTAYCLAKRGHDVTIVDERPGPALAASHGNGAQLSYSYVAPLADPGVWKSLPKYLLSSDSPLQWKPQFDAAQWRWIFRFLRACNASASRSTTIELLRLAFYSRDCLQSLQSELHLEFDFRTAGKLVMLESPQALSSAKRQVDFQNSLGCEQQVLSTHECVEVENRLESAAGRWAGGVYTPGEQVGDCAAFCAQLADAIRQRYPSTRFLFNTLLTGALVQGQRVFAFQSTQGNIEADAFVLAAGAGSTVLARSLDLNLPVYPLKGYSVTLDANQHAPHVSITDLARKIVYARIGNRLRIAGRVEIVGNDRSIDPEKCRALANAAQELFPGLSGGSDISPWVGQRPATPEGLPIIGRSPIENLYINTGQGALGWTLACGSAQLLANQIDGRPADIPDAAFRC